MNPISATYAAIYQALLANTDIKALFLGGANASVAHMPNLYPGDSVYYATNPDIEVPNSFDYPRARLMFMPHDDNVQDMQDTSDGSTLLADFYVEVYTGHQIQTRLMNACWALWTFSANWETIFNGSSPIQYNGKNCVVWAKPHKLSADEVNTDEHTMKARGTNQWISVWGIRVSMNFLTADLQNVG